MFLNEQKSTVNKRAVEEVEYAEDLDIEEGLEEVESVTNTEVMNNSRSSLHTGTTSSSSISINSMFREIHPGVIAGAGIASFVVAIVILVALVEKKKAPRSRFLGWLREYLNFRSILISGIIKFVYLFLAVFLTVGSVIVMCSGRDEMVLPMIGIGFAIMVFGNISLRIMMELTMAMIVIWENTSDIRSVVVKEEEMPEEKKPKEPKEPKESKESKEEEKEKKEEEKPVAEKKVEVTKQVETQQAETQQAVAQQAAAQQPTAQQPAVAQQAATQQPQVSQLETSQ